jgi:hypothetical protein
MTRNTPQSVQDDIAYMRALAHEGRHTPQLGGTILITAGAVFGLSAIGHFLIDYGVINLPPISYSIMWGAAMVVFFATLIGQKRGLAGRPGAGSAVNRATSVAWMAMGLGCFALVVSMVVLAWKTSSSVPLYIFPSLIFALYGAAWAVSAEMSGLKWQWKLSIGAWIAAPAIALLIGTPFIWLGYAAGIFLFALVPGLILRRQEPAEVI